MVFKNGFKEYAVSGLIFGGLMGVMWTIMYGIVVGLISGITAGATFAFFIFLFVKSQEKKFSKMREEISYQRRVICDGGATFSGNGGWMFLTDYGIEFYPHKVNFSQNKLFIPIAYIANVTAKYNKIGIDTVDGMHFDIVVSNSGGWKEQIDIAKAATAQTV